MGQKNKSFQLVLKALITLINLTYYYIANIHYIHNYANFQH